jgi:hypothetical protein
MSARTSYVLTCLLAAATLTACGDDRSPEFPLIDATSERPDATDASDTSDADTTGEPVCPDADSDGLCEDYEQSIGTDPERPDSDDDGFWDGWEDAAGTDPLDPADHPSYVLPEGDAYALEVAEFVEPSSLAGLVSSRLGDAPPVLLFADGLSDGVSDSPVELVGGLGELVSWGSDETPQTADDVYAMERYSIEQTDGDYIVEMTGQSEQRVLAATADTIRLDLSGFSAATEGLALRVDEVEVSGTLTEDLYAVTDVTLTGKVSDEGLDELIEALKDRLPVSKEQALEILDPDGDGIIPVEIVLDGHRVIVDGFTNPDDDRRAEPRAAQTCCPAGVNVGDPIYPYLTWQDQGIQDDEYDAYQLAVGALEADPDVALFATAIKDEQTGEITYWVFNGGAMPAGSIEFRRVAGQDGADETFEILSQIGDNPLANNNPLTLGTYEDFLAAGENPSGIDYVDRGYVTGDERVVFVPVDQMHYGFAFERLTQIFDDPRAGDMVVLPPSWATGGFGTHGNLNNLQSRSPLIIAGPGVRNASEGASAGTTVETMANGEQSLVLEDVSRAVDIAPTIAAALGISTTSGVGPDGRFRDDVRLRWQDGQVLEQVFDDEAVQKIQRGEAVAEHAVIIINDGLTSIEILYQTLAAASEGSFDVDQYRGLMSRGVAFRYGSITNYPSNTYPSHNTVGSGAWSGHHGIINNRFWQRDIAAVEAPIQDIFETEYLFGSAHAGLPVETLHEATRRSFGSDTLTASVNDPSTRGAPLATLQRRYPEGFSLPDASETVTIAGTDYVLPSVDIDDYTGVLDNASAQTFASVYLDDALELPKYTIVNFGSTDTAGHAYGPHGDQEREVVIGRVNQRLEVVFAALEEAGILDKTLVVLTSDHGMELQDSSRMGSTVNAVGQTDPVVRFRKVGKFVYFKMLDAVVTDNQLQAGQTSTVTLDVYDSDTRWADEPTPVSGVLARVVDGGSSTVVATDAAGQVSLEIEVDPDVSDVLIEIGGDSWTPHRTRIPVN